MEATEAEVYRRLAKAQKDSANREILERIAREEERHEAVIGERTGKEVRANRWMVFWQILLARFFGLTFTVKMMENSEKKMASEYRKVGLDEIAEEEEAHEAELVGMLEEEGLRHLGSLILGLSDALVELTGALAGQGGSLRRNWLHRHCFPARNAIPNSHRRRPVAAFNAYLAVAQDQSFGKRFTEMADILIVVSAISFGIGIALRTWFGLEI